MKSSIQYKYKTDKEVFSQKGFRPFEIVLFVLLLFSMTYNPISSFCFHNRQNKTLIYNYNSCEIVSNSMYPILKKDDIVIIKRLSELEKRNLNIGDIAVYYNSYNNEMIIHRIIKVEKNGYIFKGDNNKLSDGFVSFDNVVSLYIRKKPLYFNVIYISIVLAIIVLFDFNKTKKEIGETLFLDTFNNF